VTVFDKDDQTSPRPPKSAKSRSPKSAESKKRDALKKWSMNRTQARVLTLPRTTSTKEKKTRRRPEEEEEEMRI